MVMIEKPAEIRNVLKRNLKIMSQELVEKNCEKNELHSTNWEMQHWKPLKYECHYVQKQI